MNFKFSAFSADFSFGPKNPKVYHTEIVSPSKGVDGFFGKFQKRSLCSQMAIRIVGVGNHLVFIWLFGPKLSKLKKTVYLVQKFVISDDLNTSLFFKFIEIKNNLLFL